MVLTQQLRLINYISEKKPENYIIFLDTVYRHFQSVQRCRERGLENFEHTKLKKSIFKFMDGQFKHGAYLF